MKLEIEALHTGWVGKKKRVSDFFAVPNHALTENVLPLKVLQFGAMTYYFAACVEVLHMWAEQLHLLHFWYLTAGLRHQAYCFWSYFHWQVSSYERHRHFPWSIKNVWVLSTLLCNRWQKYTHEGKCKNIKAEKKNKRPAKLRPSCNSCVPEKKIYYLVN